MKILNRLAVFCATISLISGVGYAQGQSQESGSQQSGAQQSSSGAQQKAPVEFDKSSTLGGQRGLAMRPGQKQVLFVASDLIGKKVSSAQGEKLGTLSEIIFGTEQGIFGVLELGNKGMTAVPWQLVIAVTDDDVVMNTTNAALRSAPTLKEETEFQSFNDPKFTQQLFSYFGVQKQGMGSGGAASQGSDSQSSQSSQSSQDEE